MGSLKIEIDLPEFEKELSVNITIKRDGEVYVTSSSTPEVKKINEEIEAPKSLIGEDKKTEAKKKSPKKPPQLGGNLMDITI